MKFFETRRDFFHSLVVEPKPVDQGFGLWNSENPRAWIPDLRLRGDRSDLDETKSQGCPGRERHPVLVKTGCQPDWIGKTDAEEFLPQPVIACPRHQLQQPRKPRQRTQ